MTSLRSLLVLALLLAFAGSPGAQLSDNTAFKTTFPFTAGNTKFPAGSYEIVPVENELAYVEILTKPSGPSAFIEVRPAQPSDKATKSDILFQKYGDKYLLKSFRTRNGLGYIAVPTQAEKMHAKAGAPTDQHVTPTSKD